MFNMTKIKAVRGDGRSFYMNHLSSNDYYSEHEKVQGRWCGRLALEFDLWDAVSSEEFSLFQRNINPKTLEKLTQRTVKSGVRFFDFQCAAPKSVSIISLFDSRLLQAHEEAVQAAMHELEDLAAVRVRTGENVKTRNYELTGKLLYARFTHDTSRALDPQLHTHNVVVNLTQDADGNYKALEALEMCRAIRYAGKVYHNHLARKCRELGYETVDHRDEKGRIVWFDLKGVSAEVMELYSKRRREIEAEEQKFITEHGRKPTLAENNFLSMTTRENKLKTSDRAKVRQFQLSQLSDEQRRELNEMVREAGRHTGSLPGNDIETCVRMIREALPQLYERESVLKLDKILGEVLNRNLGHVELEVLKQAVPHVPELCNLGGLKENPWYSPQEEIDRELYAIEAVERQRNLLTPIAPEFEAFPGEESRQEQAAIIHGLLNSPDRFNLFRGVAGSGKTSTLQELCRGLQSGGLERIYLIAPTNSAVEVLKGEGFQYSSTVASFLLSEKKPEAGSYVIIDESGLNSLREGAEIIRLANENDYRMLFVGDARQHTSVESGDFFRLLENHSGIARFELRTIRRQQSENYRAGIAYCADGYFQAAFDTFEENGFIHEGKSDYLKKAAESYLEFTENGRFPERAILVAPTHDECDNLTSAVRERLKAAGVIARTGRMLPVFRSLRWEKAMLAEAANYRPGMAVSFVRSLKDIAEAGEYAVVESVADGMLHFTSGKSIHLRRSADYIEVGELREMELCPGDVIQFGVNLKSRKIYNGNLARIVDDPAKIMLLNADGTDRGLVDFPENCSAISPGWVTTSYKSQGRTADTVVVAAQEIDRKSFYVALSRGRLNMALHCPDKEFLKEQLLKDKKCRLSVHDLVDEGEIPRVPERRPLPEEVRLLAAEKRPDTEYKSVEGRLRKLRRYLKGVAARVRRYCRRVADRRSRNARYGFGIVTEKTLLELEKEHAVEFPAVQPPKPLESEPVIKELIRQGNAVPDEPKPAVRKNNAPARSRSSWGWDEFEAWIEEEKRKHGGNDPEPGVERTAAQEDHHSSERWNAEEKHNPSELEKLESEPVLEKVGVPARSRNSWGWEEFDAWVEEEKRKLNEREAAQKELEPESKPKPKKEKAVKSRSPERAQPRFPAPPEIPKDSGRGMDL